MRIVTLLAAGLLLTAAGISPGLAASPPKVTRIAASNSCAEQRKVCYAGRTQTGSNGTRYVPPEVVAECEGAYRACMQGH